jgi:hemin uptake protein HemP
MMTLDITDLTFSTSTGSITHNGTTYRLQATRLGKLILTK